MVSSERIRGWIAPIVASIGFVGLLVVFVNELGSFRVAVGEWARRDLDARAELAAKNLSEPLRTGDFRAIYAMGAECEREGLRLTAFSSGGGVFYDSRRRGMREEESVSAIAEAGDFRVRMSIPRKRVLAPFRRAKIGFVLAALTGGVGMLVVFFVTYRQHVRIVEMRRVERFRSEFIADVSHELKTPLTGIIGAADMLGGMSGALDPQWARLVSLLVQESKRLDSLAQGILDLAKLERMDDALKRTDCDLAQIAEEAVESFRARYGAAGMDIELRKAGEVRAKCDSQLVFRAISNLLANALRHSGSKDVVVEVARKGQACEIAVEDHGKGIATDDAKRVFERFYRVDASRTAETGGAGLGLAIVRMIAALHGGSVRLDPVQPHGCRFTIAIGG